MKTEFHQLLLPSGDVIELSTDKKKWVLSSQGWGIPPINWQTTQGPYQHGQTVRDYRLQPRTIQLLINESFCSRDAFWAGREALINSLRPNQAEFTFEDYWLQRTQADTVVAHDRIVSLCEWNGHLYGLTNSAHLLVWDDVGAWSIAAEPPSNSTVHLQYGYSLCAGELELPDYTTMSIQVTNPIPTAGAAGSRYVYQDEWVAQLFHVSNAFSCGGARIYATVDTNTSVELTVSIQGADGALEPDGVIWGTATISVTREDSGWIEVAFPPVTLLIDNYYLVVSAAMTVPADRVYWSYTLGDAYPYGFYAYSSDAGVNWTIETAPMVRDYIFEILMLPNNVTKNLLWATGRGDDGGTTSLTWAFDGTWSPYYWAYHTDDTEGDSSIIFDGELLIGTGQLGKFRQYPRLTADHILDDVGDSAESFTKCLAVHTVAGVSRVYGGTTPLAKLWQWDGVNTVTEVAPQAGGTETEIFSLAVYQGKLYGVSENGRLYQWNDANAWVSKSDSLALGAIKYCLCVYKGKLYCAGQFGDLYVWDGVSAWELVCSIITIGAPQSIFSMATYRNRMFAGTTEASALIEYIHNRVEDEVEPLILRRHLSNGEDRDLEVVISEGPQFDDQSGGWREWSFKELLRLTAYNPVMYDPDVLTVAWTMGVGFIDESKYLTYTGNFEEHPVITVAGPLNGLTVINETVDVMFELDYDIPDGVTVTIDCAKLTITDSLHNNLIGALTPESEFARFRFEPVSVTVPGGTLVFPLTFPLFGGGGFVTTQANLIRVVGNGADAGTTLSIDYYRRFIGI